MSTIDLANEEGAVFDASQWIRCGRTYKDVPLYVCGALTTFRKIPEAVITTCIPRPDLRIIDFINLTLPRQSSELVTTQPGVWFSTDPPDEIATSSLASRTIPPKAFLDKLDSMMGQEMLNGSISIIDHRVNGGRGRDPVWALTYWQQMSKIISMQAQWKRAKEWIDSNALRLPGFPAPDIVFAAHAWNMPLLHNNGFTNLTLAQLFTH